MSGSPGPGVPRGRGGPGGPGGTGGPGGRPADDDVLELGGAGGAGRGGGERDGRRSRLQRRHSPWSRRTWSVVVAAGLLVVTSGWVVEDRLRDSTEVALERCRTVATEQVAATEKSLATMADYLRPGLLSVPVEARDSLYVAMSEAAVDDVPRVRRALETCRAVDATWLHPDLQQRRDDYVGYLTETVALLETVVEDGRLYYRDTPELDAGRERLFGTG